LISTGVTAASYTAASITVDADGRITAASSGSGGAGMGIPTLMVAGPASGTYTAAPTANRIGVYMYAGGGNTGPCNSGGDGGGGFWNKPITQPFSQPYAVGGATGNTTLTNVGTANAGANGSPSNPGAAGNQPGSSLTIPMKFRGGAETQPGNNFGQVTYGYSFSKGASNGPATGGAMIIFENTGT
jgi:hypothetical protein